MARWTQNTKQRNQLFFIETENEFVLEAYHEALKYIPENAAIICESGSMRKQVKPSLFILLHTKDTEPKDSSKSLFQLADHILNFEAGKLNVTNISVTFTNNQWKLYTMY